MLTSACKRQVDDASDHGHYFASEKLARRRESLGGAGQAINATDAVSDQRFAGDGGNGIDDRICDRLKICTKIDLPLGRGGDKQIGGLGIQAGDAAPAGAGLGGRCCCLGGAAGRGRSDAVNLGLSRGNLLSQKAVWLASREESWPRWHARAHRGIVICQAIFINELS